MESQTPEATGDTAGQAISPVDGSAIPANAIDFTVDSDTPDS